jgi:hypothetical protein
VRWNLITFPDSITVFSNIDFVKFLKPKSLFEEKLLKTVYQHSKKYMEEILKEEKEKMNSSIVSLEEIKNMMDFNTERIQEIIGETL